MLDFSHIPNRSGGADVQFFVGISNGGTAGESWQTWQKPRGKSMCHILLVGRGGNGGTGVIGANSTAAGGGGGGSGGQTSLILPLWAVPDTLYLALPAQTPNAGVNSVIAVGPNLSAGPGTPAVQLIFAMAAPGGPGGNAAGATAGAAGTAAGAAAAANMSLGWQWTDLVLGGVAGVIGGTTGAAGAFSFPTTGVSHMGGTGGGGLPAAAAVGTAGGSYNGISYFGPHGTLAAATAATIPPADGPSGFRAMPGVTVQYGGLGGGSTHGSATGAGLVQASGGYGAPGCGGGGMGGALTGSTAGRIGLGGSAYAVITCW